MLISHSHHFIFFHVTKVAGISIANALKPYTEEPNHFRIARPVAELKGKPNPMYEMWKAALLHAKAKDVKKELTPNVFDTYFKFAFVRNPWDWQVSMRHFILKETTHIHHERVKAMHNFEEYLNWVMNTKNPYPKGGTKFQKQAIADDEGHLLVDYLGRFEDLATGFNQVCQHLNLDTSLPHLNKSRHSDYKSYYDDTTREMVADYFKDDIRLFGYQFDSYDEQHPNIGFLNQSTTLA